MRKIYSLLIYLLIPLIPIYLKKRGKKNPEYLKNWHERFSWNICNQSQKPIIWFHAVSVGETRAMQKLVELFHVNNPEYQILITNMTPTGRDTAHNLYPYAIIHYVPYDINFCVKKFYQTFKPKIGIIMETEIWPNLIHFGARYGVSLYLVNARLSDKSYNGYRRFKWALMPILNKICGILCQDGKTQDNFRKLNYQGNLQVVGNTKFDLTIDKHIITKIEELKKIFGSRKIIIFASSRDGEEEVMLSNIKLKQDIIYLFVPRHPERFKIVEQLLIDRKINYQLRSLSQNIKAETQIVIGDSMGEMLAYYAISHLAIIGGSFKEYGGQNPIEAIYMEIPVIFGASMYNFADVANKILEMGCGKQVVDIGELNYEINKLLGDDSTYKQLKLNCKKFININHGASLLIYKAICNKL